MIRRLGADLLIILVAWGLRRGIEPERMRDHLAVSFSHRDEAWRDAVLADARTRNRRKILRKILA